MRDASASQFTAPTGTSPVAWRSMAASASSRGGSAGLNGLNELSLCIESAIVAPKEAREDAAQMAARLVKVPAHRARREIHHLADLGARQSIDVEQRDDHPLPLRQRRQRLLQNLSGVAPLALEQRGRRVAHTIHLGLGAAARARAAKVGAAIEHDPDEPRAERAARLERVE